MRLCELMNLGDDNALGRCLDNATKVLTKLKNNSDKEICKLACGLLQALENLDANPSMIQNDGYSLMQYIMMLTNPKVGKNTLRFVTDALGSYSDETE